MARIGVYRCECVVPFSSTQLLPDFRRDGHVSNIVFSHSQRESQNGISTRSPYSLSSARRRRRLIFGSVFSALSLILIRHLSSPFPYDGFPYLGLEDMLPRREREIASSPTTPDRKRALLGPPTERFRGMSTPRHPFPSTATSSILTQIIFVMTQNT